MCPGGSCFIFNDHPFLHCLITHISIHMFHEQAVALLSLLWSINHSSFILHIRSCSHLLTFSCCLVTEVCLQCQLFSPLIVLLFVRKCWKTSIRVSFSNILFWSSVYCHRGKRLFTFNTLTSDNIYCFSQTDKSKYQKWYDLWFYSRRLIHWVLQFVCFYVWCTDFNLILNKVFNYSNTNTNKY